MAFRAILPSIVVSAGLLGGCNSASSGEAEATRRAAAQAPPSDEPTQEEAPPQDEATPPEKATASHILITYEGAPRASARIARDKDAARVLAQQVLEKAKAGEDFAKLAKKYSDGPSGPRGGKLGTFPRGRMVPAFDEAVFGLTPGSVAPDLVETPFGFHVVYREK